MKAPFIGFELDAIENAERAAAAAGVPVHEVVGGLPLCWRWCWRMNKDTLSPIQLAGFFRPALTPALVAFGFLEAGEGPDFRVAGAERLLGITAKKAASGKARAASALRDSAGKMQKQPADIQRPASGGPAASQLYHPTPNTQHQEAKTAAGEPPKSAEPQPAPPPAVKPTPPPAQEPLMPAAADFAAWAQGERADKFGALPEHPDRAKFDAFWLEFAAELGGEQSRAQGTWLAYLEAEWPQSLTPTCPWSAFLATWRKYVPNRAAAPRPEPPGCAACGGTQGQVSPVWGRPLCSPCFAAYRAEGVQGPDTDAWVSRQRSPPAEVAA